jgi:multiple antibiotic resistance protein
MWDVVASGVLAIPALLLIVDPLAAVPVFLALTTGESPLERRAIARRAAVTAGLVLAVFALAGGLVFRFFGITLGGFQIAGGLLLLRISLDMLAPRPRSTPGLERSPSPVDVSLIPAKGNGRKAVAKPAPAPARKTVAPASPAPSQRKTVAPPAA